MDTVLHGQFSVWGASNLDDFPFSPYTPKFKSSIIGIGSTARDLSKTSQFSTAEESKKGIFFLSPNKSVVLVVV